MYYFYLLSIKIVHKVSVRLEALKGGVLRLQGDIEKAPKLPRRAKKQHKNHFIDCKRHKSQ